MPRQKKFRVFNWEDVPQGQAIDDAATPRRTHEASSAQLSWAEPHTWRDTKQPLWYAIKIVHSFIFFKGKWIHNFLFSSLYVTRRIIFSFSTSQHDDNLLNGRHCLRNLVRTAARMKSVCACSNADWTQTQKFTVKYVLNKESDYLRIY